MTRDVVEESEMPAEVIRILNQRLGQSLTELERSRIYDVVDKLLQRDIDLGRARLEKEMQLDLRAREDQHYSARRAVVSMLSLSVIVFTAGVTLALKGSQDIGLFLLGCTAAFLREALVSYR